jgi:hypothetical protein
MVKKSIYPRSIKRGLKMLVRNVNSNYWFNDDLLSANQLVDQLNSSEGWGRQSLSKEQLEAIKKSIASGALIVNRGRRRMLKALIKKTKH